SILAVLRCLALPRIEGILGALMENADFQLVRFENQPSTGAEGVPDAEISAHCRILVETKLKRNSLGRPQLERHLRRLDATGERDGLVLVLTPDDARPALIAEVNDR